MMEEELNTRDGEVSTLQTTGDSQSSFTQSSNSTESVSCPTTPKDYEKKTGAKTSVESSLLKLSPRATRSSQNPDFAAKQRKFLHRVHDPVGKDNYDSENSQDATTPVSSKSSKETKHKSANNESKRKSERDMAIKRSTETDEEGSLKKRRTKEPTKVIGGVDSYCWRCHRDGTVIRCEICPRVYHLKCIQMEDAPPNGWMCPECSTITNAENTDTRSRAMRMLTIDQFCNLLRFALDRMKSHEGSEEFEKPVDVTQFPQYRDFIVKPMDLSQLKANIKAKMYGSTEAFLADAKWIVHNSIIFNSVQSKFTNSARALLKICRQEMQEIENCPDCYLNAHTRSSESWFIEACRRPHLLVWAKLKGFPFWPAKAMTTNSEGLVDVRFFGAHDRAWVPLNSCFLYSKLSPAPSSNKNKRNLEECVQELESHIKKLRDKFGQFEYPPYKTPYDPRNEDSQLAMFLPMYEAKTPGKRPARISLHQDGARKSLNQRKIFLDSDTSNQNVIENSINDSTIQSTSPMVSFPSKGKSLKQTPTSRSSTSTKPLSKGSQRQPSSGKQSSAEMNALKTPLTPAAKKCFATKGKTCSKCQSQSASNWFSSEDGSLLCSDCSSTLPVETDKPQIEGKICAICHTCIAMSWLTNSAGLTICSSCECAERLFKKMKQIDDGKSTLVGTVTVQRKHLVRQEKKIPDYSKGDGPDIVVNMNVDSEPMFEQNSAEGSGLVVLKKGGEPLAANENSFLDIEAVDSPPKFIISKASGVSSAEASKNVSIVDKLLQEKLCFAVEEAIKDHIGSGEKVKETTKEIAGDMSEEADETRNGELNNDVSLECIEKNNLKSDKKVKQSGTKGNSKKINSEQEVQSEYISELDADASSSLEADHCDENCSKKKKEMNINNVVRSLKERKSSIDEKNEPKPKVPKVKGSNTLLNETNIDDDISVLVIDENEYNSSENKKSEKLDKNRRKGIPAKVCSRSSTSTESVDATSPEGKSKEKKQVSGVLDEVSGQFRRSSEDSDVTIMLESNEISPTKKTPKKLRTVNISKSISMSVINESSADLEMECLEGDFDDQTIVDLTEKKVPPKPTARKTLPNLPKTSEVCRSSEIGNLLNENRTSDSDTQKPHPTKVSHENSTQSLPLINLRHQTKVREANKEKSETSPSAVNRPNLVKTPAGSTPPLVLGAANAQMEEAVQKISGSMRLVVEEMLRSLSESGVSEATLKALQVESERQQWRHRQEIAEIKHNTDLVMQELRRTMEVEKQRALLEAKHKYEMEKEQLVQEVKRKQWCAFCLKESQLYCCWNTSYCSYTCQQQHWVPHMGSCKNNQQQEGNPQAGPRRLPLPQQPQPSPSSQAKN